MVEKVELVDVSKCIGCRGCQLACKQWNQLPAGVTVNQGTYQNPPDLQPNTWTLVRFREVQDKSEGVKWLFRKDSCMHCNEATCVNLCPAGARFRLDSGAIGTDNEKCVGCQSCVVACPFGKPKYSEESNKAYKCKLCTERVANNLLPACVKACPTGALKYGDKDKMLALAYQRAKELGGEASVYGDKFFGCTHVIYVLDQKIEYYDGLPTKPKVVSSAIFWKDLMRPFGALEAGIGLGAAAILSYSRSKGLAGKDPSVPPPPEISHT
jgi:formate dehydrogenase iron-sulfur subunit